MLIAQGQQRFGTAAYRSSVVSSRDVLAIVVERHGLTFDTSCTPTASARARDVQVFWIVFAGDVLVDGQPHTGPVLLAMPEHAFVGANGQRTHRIIGRGKPFNVLELRVRSPGYLQRRDAPEVVPLAPAVWDALRPAYDRLLAPELAAAGTAGADLTTVLAELARVGLVTPTAAEGLAHPPNHEQLTVWNAVSSAYTKLATAATIKALVSLGRLLPTPRQVERVVTSIFDEFLLPGVSWGESIRYLRLGLASLLLSTDLKIGEIARTVGYTHQAALANAFRLAGLPSPREVREVHAIAHLRQRLATQPPG